MGSCLSKKGTNSSSPITLPDPQNSGQLSSKIESEKSKFDEKLPKKEIFVIKHRNNNCWSEEEKSAVLKAAGVLEAGSSTVCIDVSNCGSSEVGVVEAAPVRTSICNKEEVDAILIQCGRLSRSSSMGKVGSGENAGTPQRGKKYSWSKRSYDFDNEGREKRYDDNEVDDDDVAAAERVHRHRQRHHHARAAGSSSPHCWRRTRSRERDQQQRSNSREKTPVGRGRRVSVSPGRRSESPITSNRSTAAAAQSRRPGKMVSVPGTVSSIVVDKSNNGGGAPEVFPAGDFKMIQVKRDTGEHTVASRTAASPRSGSPARAKTPARANSPARTNLKNSIENQPLTLSRSNSRKAGHSPYRRNPLGENDSNSNTVAGFESNKVQTKKSVTLIMEETNNNPPPVTVSLIENPKPQLSRTRSARKLSDLDMNLESLLNTNPSYTTLLLEDIQNFHQKNHNPANSFSLPPCLAKACSILEAVADLKEDSSTRVKKRVESSSKEPIMETELIGYDDLMQPCLHKYVTVRRGVDTDELESSGSNSYICSDLNNLLSSCELNSADSADCYTCSKPNIKEENAGKNRESNNEHIVHGRVGICRGIHSSMSN